MISRLENQQAHGASRELASWASLRQGIVPEGNRALALIWHRTDSLATCSRAWARLDPLSVRGAVKSLSHRRFGRDRFRRDRAPNGVA